MKLKPRVEFTIDITLTEKEARALDALAGYGTEAFLEAFYEKMGKSYLQPYERDLRELFEKIKDLRPAISEIMDARKKLGA